MQLKILKQKRECGSCSACCEVEGVEEIGKPIYAKCEHMCGTGCGIYADRPQGCRAYSCLYLNGLLGESDAYRPDNCGLLLSTDRNSDGVYLHVCETRPGALDDIERVRYLAAKVVSKLQKHSIEKIVATLLYRYGSKVGCGFAVDAEKFPEHADTAFKMQRVIFDARHEFGMYQDYYEPNAAQQERMQETAKLREQWKRITAVA